VEELRMLSNFQLGDRALLQSFIVGQPELRQVMQSGQLQQLRQRVIASYHLGPMERAETQAYVEHRLNRVGWKRDPTFEPGAFDVIHLCPRHPAPHQPACNRVMLGAYSVRSISSPRLITQRRNEMTGAWRGNRTGSGHAGDARPRCPSRSQSDPPRAPYRGRRGEAESASRGSNASSIPRSHGAHARGA
jgi:hypothetical protein